MKILKPILLAILLLLYMFAISLFLTKLYDLNLELCGILQTVLPIVFAIVVYIVFRTLSKKEFWIAVISFLIFFVILGYSGIPNKLLTLINAYQPPYFSAYAPALNMTANLLGHTIAFVISSVIYLVTHRKTKRVIPPMPKWDELVEMLYDQELDISDSTVEKVIYSKDKSKRYLILKDYNGIFTYRLEGICQFTEEDWSHCRSFDVIPGYWTEAGNSHTSIFSSLEDALKGITQEPDYIQFF